MEELGRQDEAHRDQNHHPQVTIEGLAHRSALSEGSWGSLDQRVALEVDTSIYGLNAVLRASYKFTDRSYVFIDRDESRPGTLIVALMLKDPKSDPTTLLGDFANELLDQQVRESLAREFGDLRTLIVAQAFSEGNLLDPERDEGDYRSDPLGIGKRR